VDRATAETSQHLVAGPGVGVGGPQVVLHPPPELRQPHGRERNGRPRPQIWQHPCEGGAPSEWTSRRCGADPARLASALLDEVSRCLEDASRLAERGGNALTAHMQQPVVRMVLEGQQPPEIARHRHTDDRDLSQEVERLPMVLAARSPTQRRAADRVRRRDPASTASDAATFGVASSSSWSPTSSATSRTLAPVPCGPRPRPDRMRRSAASVAGSSGKADRASSASPTTSYPSLRGGRGRATGRARGRRRSGPALARADRRTASDQPNRGQPSFSRVAARRSFAERFTSGNLPVAQSTPRPASSFA